MQGIAVLSRLSRLSCLILNGLDTVLDGHKDKAHAAQGAPPAAGWGCDGLRCLQVIMNTLHNDSPKLQSSATKAYADDLTDLVACCLIKEPEDRPSCASLLKHPFFKVRSAARTHDDPASMWSCMHGVTAHLADAAGRDGGPPGCKPLQDFGDSLVLVSPPNMTCCLWGAEGSRGATHPCRADD